MTREAMALYLKKSRPDGALAFHISNRYMDLAPMLTPLANDGKLVGAIGERSLAGDARAKLRDGSRWIVLARDASVLSKLVRVDGWRPLGATSQARLWTDDYTDVLAATKW